MLKGARHNRTEMLKGARHNRTEMLKGARHNRTEMLKGARHNRTEPILPDSSPYSRTIIQNVGLIRLCIQFALLVQASGVEQCQATVVLLMHTAAGLDRLAIYQRTTSR